jgi:adenosylcobinamide amidohydrolase
MANISTDWNCSDVHWETLLQHDTFDLRRSGRFLVVDLKARHIVLSTSARNGGQVDSVRHLLNHQSCEGTAHLDRHRVIAEAGPEAYHERVCVETGLPADSTAMMGTAANMNYAAIVSESDEGVTVTAVVTAGVEGNATSAGEPATWRETDEGMQKVPAHAGTINTMLLINRPLTLPALARAVVTMTEGKSAALQRLAVPSKLHIDLATGTGTDQYCVAAPAQGSKPLTSASTHMKLGELVGLAALRATMEALRWQNGLETSYTRGIFHALGRYGVKEATVFDDIAPMLSEADLELLKKNSKAAFYEPMAGASAHALASTCDRIRHGMLPESVARDAIVQQAATLAANLSTQLHRWSEFRTRLQTYAGGSAPGDVKAMALRAIALGWSEKWRADV